MSVSYHYTDSADRLLADAVQLWAHGSQESAAHLAGLSAECMLKSILVGLRVVTTGADGQIPRIPTNKKVRVHIDLLWTEFLNSLGGRVGAAYLPLLPASNPFYDWLVDHRYIAANQLTSEQMLRWTWAAIVLWRGVFAHAKSQSPPEIQ
jgi:hypothetical protein